MKPAALKSHRSHDYSYLMLRWRQLARSAGIEFRQFAEYDGYPVFTLRTPALQNTGGIYISAGIHGDEIGATEGMLEWAQIHVKRLAKMPLILFPCLNPWGVAHNTRADAQGQDLNRMWAFPGKGIAGPVLRKIAGMKFRLALTLHEDYDGRGFYIYEPAVKTGWGEKLTKMGSEICPVDTVKSIDGRRVTKPGLIRRKLTADLLKKLGGYPEAGYLHLHHAARTFTFETPSEFSLDVRANTQVRLIDASLELLKTESAT